MSHWTVPHLAGVTVAADILLTGRTFLGTEAVELGIATSAVPADAVVPRAMEIATDIAENVAPMSAALSKKLLWSTVINGYTPHQVASLETQLHHRVIGSADAREGVAAFIGRRTPQWTSSVSAQWADLPDP